MTPAQYQNLERLLAPRHIAVIGGHDAAVVINECKRIGFPGAIWPVNPKRKEMNGLSCVAQVSDLPEPPDAVFLAIPRDAAIQTVAQLSALGAGGAVCYTAGFGETGSAGQAAEEALIEAAGHMAIVGPNCYGVINYVDRAALWPFAHGGTCPGYGAAIITQSGMLASDLTMNQRSVPLAYIVSAGNQTVLGLEDFVDVFAHKQCVRAIGLHIEGLRDISGFIHAASTAMENNIPIVALKTGGSAIGSKLTISHTGSLAGTDDLYQALFNKLGVIRVHTPAQLLETLKFLTVSGVPTGKRLAAFTCSGGGATMLADYAEKIGLVFPTPSAETSRALKDALPDIATVSNPLDYTTPIWGNTELVPSVMNTMLSDPYDAAIIVQDYPRPGLDEGKQYYLNDALSFVKATDAAGIPAAVCSTLPENIDEQTREMLVRCGAAPMQGIQETLDAISGAAGYDEIRDQVLGSEGRKSFVTRPGAMGSPLRIINEWQGKEHLKAAGVCVPAGHLATADQVAGRAVDLGFPVALKLVTDGLAHKTEIGAVAVGLKDKHEIESAVQQIRFNVGGHYPEMATDQFLVEKMISSPIAELLIGIRNDRQFGLSLTIGSGGMFTELIRDSTTILLPAVRREIAAALAGLKISQILDGFRGQPKANRETVIDALEKLADYAHEQADTIGEIEINPLFVLPESVCAVDILMRVAQASHLTLDV